MNADSAAVLMNHGALQKVDPQPVRLLKFNGSLQEVQLLNVTG